MTAGFSRAYTGNYLQLKVAGLNIATLPRTALSVLCLALCAPHVYAQAVPTPGVIEEQFRQPPLQAPTQAPEPTVTTVQPPSPVPAGGRKVRIDRFEISGNTSIDTEELRAIIAEREGQELTLLEIYDLADALTAHYRRQGYSLAAAVVPAQKISTGTVRIEIIEGRLGKIIPEGNQRYRDGFLRWQMSDLETGSSLRTSDLDREMLLMNELPGLQARAVMQPGDEFGTSDLVLQTEERVAEGGLQLNSYGRDSVGLWRLQADAALNGLLGVGDRFDFAALYSEANLMQFGRMGYSMPITNKGTRAAVYYQRYGYTVDTKSLGAGLAGLDISGEGEGYGVGFLHPVLRTKAHSVFLGANYERTFTRQDEDTFGTSGKSHLTLGRFSALYNHTGSDRSFSSAGVTLSTNFRGGGIEPVVGGGFAAANNRETAKLEFNLSHLRPLWKDLTLLTRFTGVVSPDPLVDLDQFRLGGPNSVRAYPAGEVGGDEGFFLSAELQHPVSLVPTLLDQRVKAFLDTGTVYRQQARLLGVREADSLTGAGVGFSANAYRYFSIDVMLAHPIGAHSPSDSDSGVRFWTAVNARF